MAGNGLHRCRASTDGRTGHVGDAGARNPHGLGDTAVRVHRHPPRLAPDRGIHPTRRHRYPNTWHHFERLTYAEPMPGTLRLS